MVIYLGSLVQLCCGEGATLQTNITGVCGECSQCLGHTGFVPAHDVSAFLVRTAQAPGCSAGELSKAGPGLRALPRSKLLRFRFSGTPQRRRLSWACVLCPSQVQVAQATRCLASALSQVGCASYSPPRFQLLAQFPGCPPSVPCVSSGELISGCDPPGQPQPSRIPGRRGEQLEACSQFGGRYCLWGQDCGSPLPSSSGCSTPASLPLAGKGL